MAMASSPALLLQSSTPSSSSSSSTLTCLYPAVSTVQSIRLPVASPRKLSGGFAVKAELQRLAVERSDAETVNRFQNAYLEKIVPALQEEFAYKNIHQIPKITKITLNCGIGDASQNTKGLDAAMNDLALIAGQRPVKTRAKNAIATFKVREGQPLGIAVTLRRKVMWSFLDRLINLGLPRTRDFQGVNPNSFDGHGNYSLGIQEQTIFPELGFESLSSKRGMDVCIVTTAQTDKEAYKLLALMGMPFTEGGGPVVPVVRKKKFKRHHFDSKAKQKARR